MIINFKQFINENLLVPRNLEGRKEKLKQMTIRMLSQEVIDGDLDLDEFFMDIDPKFVKIKKINGYVLLTGGQWTEIPTWLKDVEISKYFNCSGNKLTTLKNCPQKIGISLYCYHNQLMSLEGCPENIKGNFSCQYNQLSSLQGCPEIIEGDFRCCDNKIELILPDYMKLKGEFYN